MLAAAIKRYPVVRLLIDLRVTVVCLALLFVLTFLGTMHQIDNGIYSAQKKYFESFFTLAAGFVPLPGAQLVLWVLVVNLAAATIYRFVYKVRRIGILIIHGGLFALFFGMFFTQYFAQESFLSLLEGEGGNVTTDYFDWEVAMWDPAGEARRVAAVDAGALAAGNAVSISRYGVELRPQRYFANAQAFSRAGGAPATAPTVHGNRADRATASTMKRAARRAGSQRIATADGASGRRPGFRACESFTSPTSISMRGSRGPGPRGPRRAAGGRRSATRSAGSPHWRGTGTPAPCSAAATSTSTSA